MKPKAIFAKSKRDLSLVGEVPPKRPKQITNLAIAWTLFGLWNLYNAFQGITADLEIWDLLSNPLLPEWFRLAIPAELFISIAILVAAIIQLITVPLLLTGRPSSIKLALGVFISIAILNLVTGVLYVSAPSEFLPEFSTDILIPFGLGIFQLIIVVYFWRDLNKPEVKLFLGSIKIQETTQEKTVIHSEATEVKSGPKFYCRYCGVENKADAAFCEKCGKQLK